MKNVNDPSEWKHNEVRIHKGKKYDKLSASHNGLIGTGLLLKQIIKKANK